MRHYLCVLLLASCAAMSARAQITTCSISGSVNGSGKDPLAGATIVALHKPSGTKYTSTSLPDGRFNIFNMRVGGPYRIEISYVSHATKVYDDINLQLGTPLELQAILDSSSQNLSAVVVSADQKDALISPEHQGPSTNISQAQLTLLPTIIRNVDDFTRLVPQAQSYRSTYDGSTMGVSFAGQNNRYNQFSIDGANATDIFGLTSSGTNGGQASLNPIPFDAIEQVQIVLSPYDVTLSGFTGGGVNAVTRSGTNDLHGSVFGFIQNQGLVGKQVITNTPYNDFSDYNYGARLGGALIKNKLFFFADYEGERKTQPQSYLPGSPTSSIRTSALDSLTSFLKNEALHPGWAYNPGAYNGFNSEKKSDAFFARIDWNIDAKNKLTVRHSLVTGTNYNFGGDSYNSASFYNNGYTFKSTTNSTVVELNSNISSKMSNVFRATFTFTRDYRETPGTLFPNVNIYDNGATYTFGTETYSQANSLAQNNYTFTDNFNIYVRKHTITLGTDNTFYNSKNLFLPGLVGSYSYNSTSDFYTDASGGTTAFPNSYYTTYSTDPKNPKPMANVHAEQFSLYAQDAIAVASYFHITLGLRADIPVFLGKPAANTAFNTSDIAMNNDVATDKIPKTQVLLSPRVGFNWDVNHNRKTQIRGGVGVFTGRAPFVWVSNQYSNTGVESVTSSLYSSQIEASNVHFNPVNPYQPPAQGSAILNTTDPNFKFPRTLRLNLAVDQHLPLGLIGTIEAIYTKTIKDVLYHDLNLAPSATTVIVGNTTRPFYGQVINPNFSNVISLGNTNQGYGYSLTASITHPYTNGWTGSIAYSLGHSYATLNGTSDIAYSNYVYAYNINGLNHLDLTRNNFDLGSRIIGYVGKRFSYGKIFTTSIGLVYNGQSGQVFSYVYYGDLHGDAGSSPGVPNPPPGTTFYASTATSGADIIYMPSDSTQFTPSGGLTAGQQFQAFQTYENSTKYLQKHIGKNTAVNGDRMPWENHFDLKVAESVAIYKHHLLTITADVLNIGHLLSNKWGRAYYLSYQEAQPLNVDHFTVQPNGQMLPYFTYNPQYGLDPETHKPWSYADYQSRWSMQLGIRYTF